MKKRLDLFFTFFLIGLTTFGGGYAMIAVLKEIVVEKKKWLSEEQLVELTAVAESTPGPVAINAATYIGYLQGGILGAILGTLGVVLPSVTVILLISFVIESFLDNNVANAALMGIKVAVAFMILKVGIQMLGKMKKTLINILIMTFAFCSIIAIEIFALPISAVLIILVCAITGIISGRIHDFS